MGEGKQTGKPWSWDWTRVPNPVFRPNSLALPRPSSSPGPVRHAHSGPARFLFSLSSLADEWAQAVSVIFLASSSRTRRRVRAPYAVASRLSVQVGVPSAFISRRPSSPSAALEFAPSAQTLASSRRLDSELASPSRRFQLAAKLRVEVRKLPSPLSLSLSLSLSRGLVASPPWPSRLSSSRAPSVAQPSLRTPKTESPLSQFSPKPNTARFAVPARRRRAQSLPAAGVAPSIPALGSRSDENGPFEGDQDQVYEEEPPQCFEEGKRTRVEEVEARLGEADEAPPLLHHRHAGLIHAPAEDEERAHHLGGEFVSAPRSDGVASANPSRSRAGTQHRLRLACVSPLFSGGEPPTRTI
nr:unnamed protein product [Digitaria exilis]